MTKIISPKPQTSKQLSNSILQDELPPCEGNPNQACPGGAVDFMIKGFDDKMRCHRCHRVHVELVYQEAGESDPGSVPTFVPAVQMGTEEAAIRTAMLQKASPRGGRSIAPIVAVAPGEQVDMKGRIAGQPDAAAPAPETPAERRAKILAKYGRKR